jgi:hypothetical protein
MPEEIVGLTDDVELRKVLLRDAGFMRFRPRRAEMRSPARWRVWGTAESGIDT